MVKIIVCGGRVGRNLTKQRVYAVLSALTAGEPAGGLITIVHGDAAWVDKWSGQWARDHGHTEIKVPVDSRLDGYRETAPKNRNGRMLKQHMDADYNLGFPGGGGTFDMMDRCHAVGMPVADVELRDDGTWEVKWWPQK